MPGGCCLQEELGAAFSHAQLYEFWWCSRAWLEGRVASPTEGYTEEETHVSPALCM